MPYCTGSLSEKSIGGHSDRPTRGNQKNIGMRNELGMSDQLERMWDAVQDAEDALESRHESEVAVTAEVLLLALTSTPEMAEIFAACEADIDELAETLEQHLEERLPILGAEDDVLTDTFERIFDRAVARGEKSGAKEFSIGNMLVALFAEYQTFAVSELNHQGVTRRDVENYISHGGSRSKPDHPGVIAQYNMEVESWTVNECASRLGVPPTKLARLLKGRIGVSASMALALERIGWCTAEYWMHMQVSYDLACERQRQAAALTAAQRSRKPATNQRT